MFESSPSLPDLAPPAPVEQPARPDPYGDVALGVECAWPRETAA